MIYRAFVVAIIACSAMPLGYAEATAPNIVFLLSDDQRADALGCSGNRIIETPAIDQLASEGTRFTRHYITTPICYASRASIFTGQFVKTHGLTEFKDPFTDTQWSQCYPAVLRDAGYYTGFIGKWGIGGELREADFDVWHGFPGQGLYFPDKQDPTVHLTTVMGEQAVDFITNAPRDKPFALSVSFKAPHVQDQDPRQFLYDPKLESLYADVTIPDPPLSDPAYFNALPEFIRTSENRVRWEKRFATPEMYQTSVKGYYRLISGIDNQVAAIRATLEAEGLAENTIVVYTSDHGFYLGDRGLAGKWLLHDESLAGPLIIHDPRIPVGERPATRDAMTLNIDLAPTLLDLAGLSVPEGMDGQSLVPALTPGKHTTRDECFFEHHFGHDRANPIPASEGIRTDNWKYIRYVLSQEGYEELYDLKNDPGETTNLAEIPKYTKRLEKMRVRWTANTGSMVQ